MAWLCAVRTGHFAYCADLNVRFLAPIRPGDRIVLRAWLDQNKKGRLFLVRSEAINEAGTTIATAIGKYIPVSDEEIQTMADDFVGSLKDVFKTGSV